jgi:hypothetical protein
MEIKSYQVVFSYKRPAAPKQDINICFKILQLLFYQKNYFAFNKNKIKNMKFSLISLFLPINCDRNIRNDIVTKPTSRINRRRSTSDLYIGGDFIGLAEEKTTKKKVMDKVCNVKTCKKCELYMLTGKHHFHFCEKIIKLKNCCSAQKLMHGL